MFDGKFIAFSGCGNSNLARQVLQHLDDLRGAHYRGLRLTHLDYSRFQDREPDFFPVREAQDAIAGSHVLVFQSGHKLKYYEELKDLIFHAREKGAARITAIYFFMFGRRQDHGERFPYKINRNLRFIRELKLMGLDDLILCDIHSRETLKNCKEVGLHGVNVDSSRAFAEYIQPYLHHIGSDNFLVYSPDFGSVHRSLSLAEILGVKVIATPKIRDESGEIRTVKIERFLEILRENFPNHVDRFLPFNRRIVKGKWVVMREDEISTGSTATRTGKDLKKMGAARLFFCATHPVCVDGWKRTMGITSGKCPFDRLYFGDTIPRSYEDRTGGIVTEVPMSRIIASELFSLLLNSQ